MPPLSPTELRQIFLKDVPEAVVLDTARCLVRTYAESVAYCRDTFPGPEAHDLYPIHRRAMFERNWRGRLARYPELEVSVESNASGGCYHTEVRVGRVVMTVSAVEAPFEIVRPAVFRKTLARESQLQLFAEPEEPSDDALLYVLLLHGPLGGGLLTAPSFIHIAFPDPDCQKYVDRFNLLEYFPVLEADMKAKPATDIQRKKPRLRRDRKDQQAAE